MKLKFKILSFAFAALLSLGVVSTSAGYTVKAEKVDAASEITIYFINQIDAYGDTYFDPPKIHSWGGSSGDVYSNMTWAYNNDLSKGVYKGTVPAGQTGYQIYGTTKNGQGQKWSSNITNFTNNIGFEYSGTWSGSNFNLNTFSPFPYTVWFNNNGGTGTMEPITAYGDIVNSIPTCTFTKTKCVFDHWEDENGTTYTNLPKKSDSNGIMLYAQWRSQNGYYLMGSWGSWTTPDINYLMTQNGSKYSIYLPLQSGMAFRIAYWDGSSLSWVDFDTTCKGLVDTNNPDIETNGYIKGCGVSERQIVPDTILHNGVCKHSGNYYIEIDTSVSGRNTWVSANIKVTFENYSKSTKPADQKIAFGRKVTDPQIAPTESEFVEGWYTKDGSTSGDWGDKWVYTKNIDDYYRDDTSASLPVDCYIPLYAKWVLSECTVTFDGNGHGGSTIPAALTGVEYGSTISEPTAPTDTLYSFKGWYKEAACTNAWNFSTDTVTSNISLYAKWVVKEGYYLVGTFNSWSVTDASTMKKAFLYNSSDPYYYYVDHVYLGADDKCKIVYIDANGAVSYKDSGDVKYYKSYSGRVLADDNKSEPYQGTKTDSNYNVIPEMAGSYQIRIYNYGASPCNYALFYDEYKITYDMNDHGTQINPAYYTYNQNTVAPTAPTATHYTFDGWFTDDGTFQNEFTFGSPITDNVELHAKWTEDSYYTISFNEGNHGSGSMDSQKCYAGNEFTIPANGFTADTGYRFVSWSDGVKTYAPGDKITPTGNVTFTAQWEINAYTVTIAKNNAYGTLDKTTIENVPYDTPWTSDGNVLTFQLATGDITVTATPIQATGYTTVFSGWSSASGTVTGATTITANFTRTAQTFNIIFDGNGATSGSTSPLNDVSYDSTTTVLRNNGFTKTGYVFGGWSDGENTYTAGSTLTSGQVHTLFGKAVSGTTTLSAIWNPDTFTIQFDGNGATSGSTTSITNVSYDGTVTLHANGFSKTGHTFTYWSDGDHDFEETETLTVEQVRYLYNEKRVDGVVTLKAKWEANPCVVTFDNNGYGTAPAQFNGVYGGLVTKPDDPSQAGYYFAGWYTDRETSIDNDWDFATDTLTGDITLYAKWRTTTNGYYIIGSKNYWSQANVIATGSYTSGPNIVDFTNLDLEENDELLVIQIINNGTTEPEYYIPSNVLVDLNKFYTVGKTTGQYSNIIVGTTANYDLTLAKTGSNYRFRPNVTLEVSVNGGTRVALSQRTNIYNEGFQTAYSVDDSHLLNLTAGQTLQFYLNNNLITDDATNTYLKAYYNVSTTNYVHSVIADESSVKLIVKTSLDGQLLCIIAGPLPDATQARTVSGSDLYAIKNDCSNFAVTYDSKRFDGRGAWYAENITLTAGDKYKIYNAVTGIIYSFESLNDYTTSTADAITLSDGYAVVKDGKTNTYYFEIQRSGDTTGGWTKLYVEKWTHTVTFLYNDGSRGTYTTSDVIRGNKVEKPEDPTREGGWTFVRWNTDQECTKEYNFDSAVTSSFDLYALWEVTTYTVTFDVSGSGSVTSSSISSVSWNTAIVVSSNTVTIGSTTVTANANAGYHFGGWLGIPEGDNPTVTSNLTITATFIADTYNIGATVVINTNTTLTVKVTVPEGGVVRITLIEPDIELCRTGDMTVTEVYGKDGDYDLPEAYEGVHAVFFGINANGMTCQFTVNVLLNNSEIKTQKFTVAEILQNYIINSDNTSGINVAASLLWYGEVSQTYFDYKPSGFYPTKSDNEKVNTAVNAVKSAVVPDLSSYTFASNLGATDFTNLTYSVGLYDTGRLLIAFNSAKNEANPGTYKYNIDKGDTKYEITDTYKGKCAIIIEDIKACNYNKTYDIGIYEGSTKVGRIKVSVLSFANTCITTGGDYTNIGKSLYQVYNSCSNYKAA